MFKKIFTFVMFFESLCLCQNIGTWQSEPNIGTFRTNGGITISQFTISEISDNGSVAFSPSGGTYDSGTVVTVTATANTGYTFSSWSGDLTGSTNPQSITVNANKSVTATFTINSYTLTTSATNGTVTANPSGGTYNYGTVVTVTASPSSGYVFTSWTGDLSGSTNPSAITISANKSVTANFGAWPTFTLTMTAGTGGSVSPATGSVDSAANTAISATPNTHYSFNKWTRSGTAATFADSTDATTTVALTANATVTGNFTCIAPTLTYTQNPECIQNVAFSHTIASSAEFDSIKAITTLPTGLTINKLTGTISGTPTTATASAEYTIRAYGCSNTDFALTLEVVATPVPVISSISPVRGGVGTRDTIDGSVFGSAPVLYINSLANVVPTISATNTRIIFDAPSGYAGSVNFIVKNSTWGTYDTVSWIYDTVPNLASISRGYGKLAGGDTMALRGSDMTGVDTVWWGANKATILSKSNDSIRVIVPSSATSGLVNVRTFAEFGYRDTLYSVYDYQNIYGLAISPTGQKDTLAGTSIAITARYGLTGTALVSGSPFGSYTVLTDTTATAASLAKSKGVYHVRVYVTTDSSNIVYYRYGTGGSKRRVFGFNWGGFRF